MFGYVAADLKRLNDEQRRRYNACYCGLCHTLHERHGLLARMTLTYDMTFLVMLLNSLYEPYELRGEARCPTHPIKQRGYWQSEITDYAADMNIALAYLNCIDDWEDDLNAAAFAEAKLMKASYEAICEKYPRQCEAIKSGMQRLKEIEDSFKPLPDEASSCFGQLMAELFVHKEDRWSDELRSLGAALGQFIYVMDACIDLRDDKRYYKYNPFVKLYGRLDEMESFRDILQMLMGSCVFHFDRLPLVRDADILKNILCSGVWSKFNRHYNIKEN